MFFGLPPYSRVDSENVYSESDKAHRPDFELDFQTTLFSNFSQEQYNISRHYTVQTFTCKKAKYNFRFGLCLIYVIVISS